MRPTVLLGRPVGPDTLRDSGIAFVATAEVLGYLGLDPATVGQDTVLRTAQAGDVCLTGNISSTPYRSEPIPAGQVERIDAPAYTAAPRSLITRHGLREGGWRPVPLGWLVGTSEPLDDAQVAPAASSRRPPPAA